MTADASDAAFLPKEDVPDKMQSPDSNSPTRFLLRCEVGSKMGLMVCTLQEEKIPT